MRHTLHGPLFALLLAGLTCSCPGNAAAQTGTPSPADAVRRAHTLYYTPVDRGLTSFSCDVQFDWKDFIEKASHKPVPDTDPRLKYLTSIRLRANDTLSSTGELQWIANTPPPEGSEGSVNQIRDGLQQIWSGFFQSWNGFLTGGLVMLDANATVVHADGGYQVTVHNGSSLARETFNDQLVLQRVHIETPTLDSLVEPAFTPSPDGLLVTGIASTYRQPPTAEPTSIHMTVRYAPVSGFQLPSSLVVQVGPANFNFQLSQCSVKAGAAATAPAPSPK